MSIQVPTASQSPPTTPQRRNPVGKWWLGVVVAVAVASSIVGERTPSTQPTVDALDPPSVDFVVHATPQVVPYALPVETFFPGDGSFTTISSSIHGRVAAGQRTDTAGAFVYTADPGGERWERQDIDVGERAWIGTSAAWMDGFVVGGAIVGPGMGSSVPTLWYGVPDGEFGVLEHPFSGPGRVDRLRVILGDMYLVGQGAAPFSDSDDTGDARFGRLLTGRPGSWTDITPPGLSVLVTDVVGSSDRIVATGGDADGAVVWWRTDPEAGWASVRLGEGTATGLVRTEDDRLVVAVARTTPKGDPTTHLFAGDHPRALVANPSPIGVRVDWLQAVPDGVIGGAASSQGWIYRSGDGWSAISLGDGTDLDRDVRAGETARGMVLVGSAAGQPAMWTMPPGAPSLAAEAFSTGWESVSILPGNSTTVLDVGPYLFAFENALDVGTVWVAAEDGAWRATETVPGFGVAGATRHADGWVLFGETGYAGVVYEGGTKTSLTVIPGLSVRYAARTDDHLIMLGITDRGPVRVEKTSGTEPDIQPIEFLPARIVAGDGFLIGASFGVSPLWTSTDGGITWIETAGEVDLLGSTGAQVWVVSSSGWLVEAGTDGIVPVVPLASGDIVLWGDGAAVTMPLGVVAYDGSAEAVLRVGTDVASGMTGVFQELVPGPGRYALATDRGDLALFRWVGWPP